MERPPLIFYHKMSELFFAVAATHQSMGVSEYDELKKLISNEWKKLDSKDYPFRNYALEKIEIVFDWFDYEDLDPMECFDSFVDYKQENEDLFSEERKTLIRNTAQILANYFAGEKDTDRKLLNRLEKVLR